MAEIGLDEIEVTTRKALLAHGASENAAHHVAEAVREAEATGNKICGLYYLQSYCQQLQSGRVNGVANPKVTLPRAGLVKVDAGLGFAQPAFAAGLDAAIAHFGGKRGDWLDLSTGVNPHPYPVGECDPEAWTALPDHGAFTRLEGAARAFWPDRIH